MMTLNIHIWYVYLGAFVVGIITLMYLYMSHKHRYWRKKGVPYVEPSIIFGNFKGSTLRRIDFGHEVKIMYNKLAGQKFGGMYFFQRPILLLRDPELIKTIMQKDFAYFDGHNIILNEETDPLQTKNLFSLKGQRWKHMRIKLTPTFTSGKMKKMFNFVSDCAEELVNYLQEFGDNKEMVEMKDVIAKFTTDVIASCAFGMQVNSLKNPDAEFRNMGRKIMDPPSFLQGLKLFLTMANPDIGKYFTIKFTPQEVTDFFRGVVKEALEDRERSGVQRNDFLDLLLQLKKKGKIEDDDQESEKNGHVMETEGKEELSLDDLTAQVFVFFLGGFETSSSTISFTLYELAINPDVQMKLREEVDKVLQANDNKLTYQGVMHDMVYLDKVIAETLRKYPPLPILDRVCTKHYTIPNTNVTLEPGVIVDIPALAMHYDSEYFPNPNKFDPERFSEEEKAKRPHFAYLPFGEGPRMCIGLRFGLMQSKVCLASLLSKYEFRLCEKSVVPFVQDPTQFFACSKHGTWLRVVKRQNSL